MVYSVSDVLMLSKSII